MAEPESRPASEPDQTLQVKQMTGDNELRSLVQENYACVYQFALASLQDSEIARRVTE